MGITYQGQESTEAVVDYGKKLGLGGFFTFDTSMDSLSPKFKLHHAIVARMAGKTPTPAPGPIPPTPTPPGPRPAPTPSPPTPPPTPPPKPPSRPQCCWSAWGSSDDCGAYPAGKGGARCNTDWEKTCNS